MADVGIGPMSAAESGQMPAVETRCSRRADLGGNKSYLSCFDENIYPIATIFQCSLEKLNVCCTIAQVHKGNLRVALISITTDLEASCATQILLSTEGPCQCSNVENFHVEKHKRCNVINSRQETAGIASGSAHLRDINSTQAFFYHTQSDNEFDLLASQRRLRTASREVILT